MVILPPCAVWFYAHLFHLLIIPSDGKPKVNSCFPGARLGLAKLQGIFLFHCCCCFCIQPRWTE